MIHITQRFKKKNTHKARVHRSSLPSPAHDGVAATRRAPPLPVCAWRRSCAALSALGRDSPTKDCCVVALVIYLFIAFYIMATAYGCAVNHNRTRFNLTRSWTWQYVQCRRILCAYQRLSSNGFSSWHSHRRTPPSLKCFASFLVLWLMVLCPVRPSPPAALQPADGSSFSVSRTPIWPLAHLTTTTAHQRACHQWAPASGGSFKFSISISSP